MYLLFIVNGMPNVPAVATVWRDIDTYRLIIDRL